MQELERILEEIKLDRANINTPPGGDADKIISMCYRRVEKIIRKHLSGKDNNVPANDGWIPVEERLPCEGKTIFCTDGEYVYLVEYDADLDAGFGDMDDIIAWLPLPEPYWAKG